MLTIIFIALGHGFDDFEIIVILIIK